MNEIERRALAILRASLDLEGAERDALVAEQCADNPELHAHVVRLLANVDQNSFDLDGESLPSIGETRVGEILSERFRLLRALGAGGMGEVWLAERVDGGFEQQVAIKLLHSGLGAMADRFRRERQILARLSHSNIAHLVDGGLGRDGRPWLAMEYVEGEPITQWCDERHLTVQARVRLLLAVCEAVQFAHRNLVIHRDIKPGNVLVTAEGVPKLLDFGIAKLVDETDPGKPMTLVMTPGYAAPEQRSGDPATTSTDVYQLGLLLFELICGIPAYHERRRLAAIRADLSSTTDPGRAYAALPLSGAMSRSEIAAARASAPERLHATLSSDLGRIVAKALAESPVDRYGTVNELVDDLHNWLEHRPVRAHRGSIGYRLRKFLGRHRAVVALGALALTAALAGVAGVVWQSATALREAARANAVQAFLLDVFRANSSGQADPIKARETTARELLDLGVQRIGSNEALTPVTKLEVLAVLGELYRDLQVGEEAIRLRREVVALTASVHGLQSLEMAHALIDLADSLQTSAHVDEQAQVVEQAAVVVAQIKNAPVELQAQLLTRRIERLNSTDPGEAVVVAEELLALLEPLAPTTQLAEAHFVHGLAHNFNGNTLEANRALAKAVAVSVEVDGFPNPALPRLYAHLGESQYRLLDIEGGLDSARRALDAAMRVQGPEHVDTLQTTMRLGRMLFDVGHTQEGLAKLQRAHQIAVDTRGLEDAFHTPQTQIELGYGLLLLGDPAAGLVHILAAIENRRRNRPGTLYLAQMLELAAACQIQLGQGDAAEAFLDEAAVLRNDGNQAERTSPWIPHVHRRASLAAARGQPDQVRSWLTRQKEIVDAAAPASMVRIDTALFRAELLQQIDDRNDARDAVDQALTLLKEVVDRADLPVHWGRALSVRGQLAIERGDASDGCVDLNRAIALLQPRLLAESPHLSRALAAHAACAPRPGI